MRKSSIFAGIFILTVFVIYSARIDEYLASLTYDYSTREFYGEIHLWCKVIYYSIPVITVFLILIPLIQIFKDRSNSQNIRKSAIIILFSLLLGPGLIVNTIFKDHWGRPRPYQVLRDGKPFAPVYEPHWGNSKDNSFPCGHASVGFFIGVPLLALRRRRAAIIVSVGFGSIVGVVRMLQGGHYLSDVVFCAIFVLLSAELVNFIVNRLMKGNTYG
jgi:lipid A 4'-phosphatase